MKTLGTQRLEKFACRYPSGGTSSMTASPLNSWPHLQRVHPPLHLYPLGNHVVDPGMHASDQMLKPVSLPNAGPSLQETP